MKLSKIEAIVEKQLAKVQMADDKELLYFKSQAKQGTLRGSIQTNPAAAVRVFGPKAVIISQSGSEREAVDAVRKHSGIELL